MEQLGIVGGGLIGRAWSIVFARAGHAVTAFDPDPATRERFMDSLGQDCDILVRHGLLGDVEAVTGRVRVVESVEAAVEGASFVQENGPEQVEVKRSLFETMDRVAPASALLASSTSAIVCSKFTESLEGRSRCLVGHPVNPPHLVPIVEICGAPWTGRPELEKAWSIYEGVGQTPVMVEREVEGFVLNRLQGALLAEAFRLVADGVVSPEDLDATLTDGLARRWSFIGPFATIELNAPGGIRDYCERYTGFYKRLAQDPPGAQVFEPAVTGKLLDAWPHEASPERLSRRMEWRNERLAALAAHLGIQPDDP
ncbi:MAG: 3-hydroxyacyl-CoA dehydrogenase [Geminicoccaceae bacterium]|nr:3-hydroxyacyl-CoA dehydrogenase [Geminicoccaceae bacterium]